MSEEENLEFDIIISEDLSADCNIKIMGNDANKAVKDYWIIKRGIAKDPNYEDKTSDWLPYEVC